MAITTNGSAGTVLSVSADLAATISDESGTGAVVFNNSPTLITPTLGTASATAIELGHATDTTIARVSAGVVSIEGVNVVTTSSTNTLTNKTLTSPVITTPTITGAIFNDGSVVFEGATANDFETTLAITDPTADRTITFPDSTGTVALTSDITVTDSSTTTLTNKTLTDAKVNLAFDAETASYTAVLANNSQVVTMSNASANTFSIPTNASVAFPVGTQINVLQIGAGQTTIQAVTSGTTTILSTGATAASPKTRTQYSMATCIKAATDTWYVVGDIS